MTYIFKRALGISLVLYIATFVVGILVGILSGVDMSSINNTPSWFWYMGMLSAVVLTALFAMWYFKNPALKASAKSGLFFGLTAIVTSFILDFALFSLGNSSGAQVNLGQYYGDFRFWAILVFVVITATAVGKYKRSGTSASA